MELNQIRCFLAVAETLNFTRAAEQCGLTQPSLSRAIKKLEQEVGGTLIRRERGHTHLTEMGALLRPQLAQALSLAENALSEAQEFSRISTTKLHLGVMCTIGPGRLISLVDHLARKVPQLDLKLRDATGEEISKMLVAGDIDVALVGMPEYPEAIDLWPLYSERYVIAFPKGHRFGKFETVPLRELDGEDYLERLNCEFDAHYEGTHGKFPYDLNIRFSSENEDWIQAMVLAGLGCALVPEFSVFQRGLQTRPVTEPEMTRTISLATVRGRRHSDSVALFSRLCRSMKWG